MVLYDLDIMFLKFVYQSVYWFHQVHVRMWAIVINVKFFVWRDHFSFYNLNNSSFTRNPLYSDCLLCTLLLSYCTNGEFSTI